MIYFPGGHKLLSYKLENTLNKIFCRHLLGFAFYWSFVCVLPSKETYLVSATTWRQSLHIHVSGGLKRTWFVWTRPPITSPCVAKCDSILHRTDSLHCAVLYILLPFNVPTYLYTFLFYRPRSSLIKYTKINIQPFRKPNKFSFIINLLLIIISPGNNELSNNGLWVKRVEKI